MAESASKAVSHIRQMRREAREVSPERPAAEQRTRRTMNEGDTAREARRRLKDQWGAIYERLSGILFAADPIGINFETNTDEYEPEVETILPRLASCHSPSEVREVVHQEFRRWFDDETVGPAANYQNIAERIWEEIVPTLANMKAKRQETP